MINRERWERLLQIRSEIHKHLEKMRETGTIGKSEEACLTLRIGRRSGLVDSNLFKSICKLGDVFFDLTDEDTFDIVESKSLKDDTDYVRCPRCQLFYGVYTRPANFDNLCDRCCSVLVQLRHHSSPLIKEKLKLDNAERMK